MSKVTIDDDLPTYDQNDQESLLREEIRLAFELGRCESDHIVEKIHMEGSSSFENLPEILASDSSSSLLLDKYNSTFSRETSGLPSSHSSRTVRFDLSNSNTQELARKVMNSNHYSPKMKAKPKDLLATNMEIIQLEDN